MKKKVAHTFCFCSGVLLGCISSLMIVVQRCNSIDKDLLPRETLPFASLADPRKREPELRNPVHRLDLSRGHPVALIVAIATDNKSKQETIYSTWGKEVSQVLFRDADMNKAENLQPLITMLKHLYQNYVNASDWFLLLSDGQVYVNVGQLDEVLWGKSDPNVASYIGLPSTTNHCPDKPGILLSKGLLKLLGPHLNSCHRFVSDCIEKYASTQCTGHARHYASMKTILVNPSRLVDAFIVHSLKHSDDMRSLYGYYKRKHYINLVQLASEYKSEIVDVCQSAQTAKYYPPELKEACTLPEVKKTLENSFTPKTQYQVLSWMYFDAKSVYDDSSIYPRMKMRLYRRWYHETHNLMSLVKSIENSPPVKFEKILNGYIRNDPLYGNEYIVDGDFSIVGNSSNHIQLRISLAQPLTTDYITQVAPLTRAIKINFIIPLFNIYDRFIDFLKMYENLCLASSENCRLVLSIYGENTVAIETELHHYQSKYPHAEFLIVKAKSHEVFARGRALDAGLAKLNDGELAFLCDVDMQIERSFLTRCRNNAVAGKQVYYPEVFKQYNMDYVYYDSKVPPDDLNIRRQHGHWANYAYGMACIYKSDYKATGGFDKVLSEWGEEDVQLFEKVLSKKVNVFRAPDVGLIHKWHTRACIAGRGTQQQYKHCLSSRAESLADRKELAEYVLMLEDKINEGRT